MNSSGAPDNASPEVDAWFAERDHPMEAEMRRVRDIVLGVDARITESIKWKTPTYAYEGNIFSFSPAKKLVSLMFHRGAEIPGDHPRLDGDGKLIRTMRFTSMGDIEDGRPDLEAAIAAWCSLKDG